MKAPKPKFIPPMATRSRRWPTILKWYIIKTKAIETSPNTMASERTYAEDAPKDITITPITAPNFLEGELLVVNAPMGVAMAPPISKAKVTPQFTSGSR